MNKPLLFTSVGAVALLLAGGTSRAWAQAGPYMQQNPYGSSSYGYGTPRLSPYLNMLRGGLPAANYYLGVLPEVERRANARIYGAQIMDLERRVEGTQEATDLFPRLTETGHQAVFANTGSYFGSTAPQRPITGQGLNRPPQRRQ
jgi:hypothetical protein